jgi:hypothetical protein
MTSPIDVHRLRLAEHAELPPSQSRMPPRHRKGEKFLKGPIPLEWLIQAARLRGRALHVGVALWHQVGLTGVSQVRLPMHLMRSMGVERSSVYRGLLALEAAGLVRVVRRQGCTPQVTILPSTRTGSR